METFRDGCPIEKITLLFAFAFGFVACGGNDIPATSEPTETAEQFVARVNAELVELNIEDGAIGWVRATYINHDMAILAARSEEKNHQRELCHGRPHEGLRGTLGQLRQRPALPA